MNLPRLQSRPTISFSHKAIFGVWKLSPRNMSLDDVCVKEEIFVKEESMYDGLHTDTCVKKEPGLNTTQNIYSDHKVKVELPEPDTLPGLESSNTTQDRYCKEEPESDDEGVSAAEQAELCTGHLKYELEPSSELLQPLETTKTELESLNPSEPTTSKREPNLDSDSTCSEDEDLALQNKANDENESYVCGICSKQFLNKDSCVEHLLKHTGIKFYSCQICGKEFRRQYEFDNHKKDHLDRKPPEQPYKCDICNREFWQPLQLVNHKNTHVVEKPYQCDICKMKYATKSGLSKHKRKHLKSSYKPRVNTVQKLFTCEICNNKLTTKNNLKKHKLIHLEDKPFYCSVCGRGFADKGNLIRHKKLHINISA